MKKSVLVFFYTVWITTDGSQLQIPPPRKYAPGCRYRFQRRFETRRRIYRILLRPSDCPVENYRAAVVTYLIHVCIYVSNRVQTISVDKPRRPTQIQTTFTQPWIRLMNSLRVTRYTSCAHIHRRRHNSIKRILLRTHVVRNVGFRRRFDRPTYPPRLNNLLFKH